jgi:iron complex outermembrane receptor protein
MNCHDFLVIALMVILDTFLLFKDSFPAHHQVWPMHKLMPQVGLGLNWRFVGGVTVGARSVAAYHELDSRLSWDVGHGVELALAGHNLPNNQHRGFGRFIYSVPTAVQREVYATLRRDF